MTNHSVVHWDTFDRAVANIQRPLADRVPAGGAKVDFHLAAALPSNIDLIDLPFHPLDDCLLVFYFETGRERSHSVAKYPYRVAEECDLEARTLLLVPNEEVEVHPQVLQEDLDEGGLLLEDQEVPGHYSVGTKHSPEGRAIRTELKYIVVAWNEARTVTSGDHLVTHLRALSAVCSICRPLNEKLPSPLPFEGERKVQKLAIFKVTNYEFGEQIEGEPLR